MVEIAVASRSFSSNNDLVKTLSLKNQNIKLNVSGKTFKGKELVSFLKNSTHAIIGIETIDKELLDNLPNLIQISKYGVGINNIDLEECNKRGVKVSFTPGTNSQSVAEFTLMLMLSSLRKGDGNKADIVRNEWPQIKGRNLHGKRIGLIGYGNIGKKLSEILTPFNVSLLIYDVDKLDLNNESAKQYDLDTVLSESDIISLHVPLNEGTTNLITKKEFKKMRDDCILLNTSRGGIVNEKDLYIFLKNNDKAYAFFDVFMEEPAFNNPLMELNNFNATSHRASLTVESILAMGQAAIDGIDL